MRRWLHFGARVVWTMDPAAKTLTVHRPVGADTVLRDADTLTEPELLPGFALPLINVFR